MPSLRIGLPSDPPLSPHLSKEGIDVGSCRIGIEHGKLKTATELTQVLAVLENTSFHAKPSNYSVRPDLSQQFMGRVRAEDGRVIVLGDKSDEAALKVLMEGRALLPQALGDAYSKLISTNFHNA